MIRMGRPDDFGVLREVQRAGDQTFREIDMAPVAEYEPLTPAELTAFQEGGRLWVSVDDRDRPMAFVAVRVLDRFAHVEQVSVHPAHARRGLGKGLLDAAGDWARRSHLDGLTLTTFADVPWNAPYYRRLGFEVLDEARTTPELRRIAEQNLSGALAGYPRLTLFRPV